MKHILAKIRFINGANFFNKSYPMKLQLYTLLLCLVFFSCGQNGNTEPTTTVVDDSTALVTVPDTVAAQQKNVAVQPTTVAAQPTTVEQIKQHYADINAKLQGGLLDSVAYKYDCNGERSGTVTYFSNHGKLAMIKHSYNEYSHSEAIDQYFISNDHLFFAHFRRSNWSFASGQAPDGATKDNITEQRFYVANEKSLLCLEKKYTKRSHVDNNPQPANVQNKQVACKPMETLIKDFNQLVEFKESSRHDCLGQS
jgi:hypothetical protein